MTSPFRSCGSDPSQKPRYTPRSNMRFVLTFLVLFLCIGCSHSRTFTGTIVTPNATWASHETGSSVSATTYRKTKDHLLVVQDRNKKLGKWSMVVETNKKEPRAWFIQRRFSNDEFHTIIESDYTSLTNQFPEAHELHGLISVTTCNSAKKFNIVLEATSEDAKWGVHGKFYARSNFHPEYVPGVILLTGAYILTNTQRNINSDKKTMPPP